MPQVPIIMPQLGESIAEATVVSINVKPGEKVAADQEIIEVETNKAVMGVTTPCAGEIAKIDAQVKETYPIGAVLGFIEASEKDAARFAKQAPPPEVQREMTEEIPGRSEETAKAEKAKSNGAGVADAMRRSWSRPLATIGSSVNLDPVLTDRKQRDPKPGPALYALRALALALAENPAAAAKLIGARVLQSSTIDIGLAIEA